jgi:DeoR/GlpR family transcriptional regulator of sugar metabolism
VNEVPDLFPQERRERILDRISLDGRVSVTELSRLFAVSEVTIRGDLQSLADQNLVVRTHGGAVAASGRYYDLSLTRRREQQIDEKVRIGQAGAALVQDGDAIFLDSSSTALSIAQHLKSHRHLTIITNSLVIAQDMLDANDVTVVMLGGTLRRDTASLVGEPWLEPLGKYNIQKGFYGAHGLNVPEGLTDVSEAEADVKRPLVAMCRQNVAVIDATKWGRVGLASFAGMKDINCVISDERAPQDIVDAVRSLGIEVILV